MRADPVPQSPSAVTAAAPGKIILFGEHAVVYGQPALAVPVTAVQATASIETSTDGIWIHAHTLNRQYRLEHASPNDPIAAAIRLTFEHYHLPITDYPITVTITSTIPVASGLGSGAAVCTAVVRALAQHLQLPITNNEVSNIVFETEKLLHGTPSGIDNTVIAYGQPVFFIKGQPPQPFHAAQPFQFLIADTGLPSTTKIAVADVRAVWGREPKRFESLFASIGDIAREARALIETASTPEAASRLGALMLRNHALLGEMTVSCPELDKLVEVATAAGALGAKLSGGGRGGNMIALVVPETEAAVRKALQRAEAKRVLETSVGAASLA
ncbi:MAG: mevalonate kinase, partial [Anaerolineales bacterium]